MTDGESDDERWRMNWKEWRHQEYDWYKADKIRQEVDSKHDVMHSEISDEWFFTQKMSVVNRGWQPMRSEYWLKKYAPLTGYSVILPGPQLSSLNVVENTPIKVWLQNKYVLLFINYKKRSFSALILFVGWQEGHPACKKNLAPAIPEVSTLGVLCGIQSNLEKIGQLNRNYENWGVSNRGLEYSAELEYWIRIVESTIQLNTNKQIHGFAYFDKHYMILMLKSICLETGILFYAYR